MPRVFRLGAYIVYFWSNEGAPREPIHVHVSEGRQIENSTKIWITSTGRTLLCNNNSKIPRRTLENILDIIESRSEEIIEAWKQKFGEVKFYC